MKSLVINVLQWEAKLILAKYKPKIVMVTGSVGKTSTKDAIYSVLASKFFVRKSQKSYNSDIGVPLTILNCENAWSDPFLWLLNFLKGLLLIVLPSRYPEWLVLEVGADRPGDIEKLLTWVKPNIVVTTIFPDIPVHVEFYESPEAVRIEESLPIFEVKEDGLVILNADDDNAMDFGKDLKARILTYGVLPQAEVKGENEAIEYDTKDGRKVPAGMRFDISYKGDSTGIVINDAIGIQHVYPILAGAGVGISNGIALTELPQIFAAHKTPTGRMRIIPGIKNTVLIDDTYNSSPVALREALLVLQKIETSGRKVAILGDMLELGGYSEEEHNKAGLLAGGIVNFLITMGRQAREIADGALDAGLADDSIIQFDDVEEAEKNLESLIWQGDVILIKGSQGMRLEKLVADIMANPEKKEELLVRQDKEWLNR